MRKLPIFIVGAAALALSIAVFGGDRSSRPAEIPGRYLLTTGLERNSLNTVVLEQVVNPSCVHCYRASKLMRSVVNDFGAKLVIKTIVVHRKDESAEASKLYFVARRHGKGEAALNAMFARKFEGNEDLEDPRVIANVASQLGILDEYVRGKDREETRSAMEADKARAIRYGVTGTPAWIVEGQLNVDLDVNNLRTVLTALLQKSV